MQWNDFLKRKTEYKKTWANLKAGYGAVAVAELAALGVDGTGAFDDLLKNGYLDKEGVVQDVGLALDDPLKMKLAFVFDQQRSQIYALLHQAGKTFKVRKFLNKAGIDLFFSGKQIDIDADADIIASKAPYFFIQDRPFEKYLALVDYYKAVEKQTKGDKKKTAFQKLNDFNLNELSVVPHRPEMTVPSVEMDTIQAIKQSPYCDQTATNMSRASIRVVLVGGDKLGPPW